MGIIPLLAITVAHWLGVDAGFLPGCIPYIEGCTSISATGRHPPGSFLFRAVELPFAAFLAILWYLVAGWLKALGETPSLPRWILVCGLTGALALVIYTTFLGTHEPLYEFMRRFGIYFYFAGTMLAQLFASLAFNRYSKLTPAPGLLRLARSMLALTLLPVILGILNLVLKNLLDDTNRVENRIEWIVALMMQAWFVLLYLAWRKTGFGIAVTADRADSRS